MALSGSFYTNVGSYWRLQLEWTATQNVASNQSTVTAKLYWISLSSAYGAVYSSATKTAAVIIAGTTTTNATSAALSGGQKKLIETQVKTITHAADGTATVALDGWFDAEVTLSGTYYGRVNLTGQSPALNTIPRASSLTSSASWTVGNSLPITISRATTSFTHNVDIYVNGVLMKQITGIGTSTTVNFTVTENKNMFSQLAQTASKATSIVVKTYSGGTFIGSKTYAGTATAPTASVLASGFDSARWIDETFPVSLSSKHSGFLHTLKLTFGTHVKTTSSVGTSNTWTWSQAEMDSLYAQIPNDKIGNGTLTIETFYDGVKVRGTVSQAVTLHVRNLEPIFLASQISYADVAAAVTAITANNQIIVQGKSSLTAYVNTTATAQKSATIQSYVVTVGKQTGNISTVTGNVNLGVINEGENQSLTIKAIDSRGFETVVAKTVTVAPWQPQTGSITLTRLNKFEASTTLQIGGNFSPVTIAGVNKNTITGLTYRYALKGTTSWTTAVAKTPTVSAGTYATTNTVITLDNTKAYDFEIVATDKFGSVTFKATVTAGQPIMFMDSVKKSVGIGKFPTGTGTFEVGGVASLAKGVSTHSDSVNTRSNVARFHKSGSSIGTIMIKIGNTPNIMFDAEISLQGYYSVEKIHIRGYTYTSTSGWHQPMAYTISGSGKQINVRFATDSSGDRVILIGNVGTNWGEYLHASIDKVTVGYGSTEFMLDNWSISLITSEVGITGISANMAYKSTTADPSGALNVDRLKINSTADASATSTDHAFTVGNDVSGSSVKIDHNELSSFNNGGIGELHVNPDGGRVVFHNNAVGGNVVIQDGRIFLTNAKLGNGYNAATIRDGYLNHDEHMLIQNVVGTVGFSSATSAYVDVTFPTAFDGVPIWILAISINAQSFAFMNAIYSPTATGCRVYARQVDGSASTLNLQVQVVACGRT